MTAAAAGAPSAPLRTPRPRVARPQVTPTGVERAIDDGEIIVSKTDLTGHLTYVNDVFLRVSDYTRAELIGAPHSVIRHPAMPRAIFDVLWEGLRAGREVFAYVVNLARNGDHYWVFAHVTPSLDGTGRPVGFHSNRRTVDRRALPAVERLYAELRQLERAVEQRAGARLATLGATGTPTSGLDTSKRAAVTASRAHLHTLLTARGQSYDEFVWSL